MKRLIAGSFVAISLAAVSSGQAGAQTWSGFYIGGNLGYGWGKSNTEIRTSGSTDLVFLVPPPPVSLANPYSFGSDAGSQRLNGINGGVHAGYNWQQQRWVLGIEADFQAAHQTWDAASTNNTLTTICTALNVGPPVTCIATNAQLFTTGATLDASIDWFGTLRGRLGWLANDSLLIYATGGLAYGRVHVAGQFNFFGANVFGTFGPASSAVDVAKTTFGYAVGAGIEGKISGAWRWKAEYLFLDFGSVEVTAPVAAASSSVFFTPFVGSATASAHITNHIVRVGLTYAFSP
jgi:outer membrane immunogenic protein